MGHERLGVLPKSKRWVRIAEQITAFEDGSTSAAEIAASTLLNVERRYVGIHEDAGVQAAFRFLCALSSGHEKLLAEQGVDLSENPSPVALAGALKGKIRSSQGAAEYGGIAERAALDAIGWWVAKHGKPGLFGEPSASVVWAAASTGAAFSTLAHKFFSKFTERYLNYFIDRVASGRMTSIQSREQLASDLSEHSEDIATHALETARITQSFAAGWYNKHLSGKEPDLSTLKSFLAVAYGKLRDELLREVGLHDHT